MASGGAGENVEGGRLMQLFSRFRLAGDNCGAIHIFLLIVAHASYMSVLNLLVAASRIRWLFCKINNV